MLLAIDLAADVEALVVLLISSLIVSLVAGFWRLIVRLNRQDALMESTKVTLQSMQAQLAREFGGNSGGIREAINGLQRAQAADSIRLDEHLESHGRHR